ncbi:hypothetical protein EKO27_g10471 [Xylaria grammica]|uniref:Uncharacterized protein n=1 Tax=Xylaria grammica TaxID=363999 RepID=A0A439CR55_9PEZI|nr:hypothetical protein EKO27_g10471 [Xylaria grammica]
MWAHLVRHRGPPASPPSTTSSPDGFLASSKLFTLHVLPKLVLALKWRLARLVAWRENWYGDTTRPTDAAAPSGWLGA